MFDELATAVRCPIIAKGVITANREKTSAPDSLELGRWAAFEDAQFLA